MLKELCLGTKGRIGRGEWWLGQVALVGMIVILFLIDVAIAFGLDEGQSNMEFISLLVPFVATVGIIFWMNIVITIKRFRDRNKSGWWVLLILVPIVGNLWVFFECGFLAGDIGRNDFGEPSEGINGRADEPEIAAAYGQDVAASPSTSFDVQPNRVQTGRVARQAGFGVRGA